MFRKTFIRLSFFVCIASTILLLLASSHSQKDAQECPSQSHVPGCSQPDPIGLESISQAVLISKR